MYLTLPKNSLGLEKILFMGTRTNLKFFKSYVNLKGGGQVRKGPGKTPQRVLREATERCSNVRQNTLYKIISYPLFSSSRSTLSSVGEVFTMK